MTPEQAESDPLAAFESCAALMTYLHRRHGEEVLREFLAALPDHVPETTCEWIEEQASHLRKLGLGDVADLVEEFADKAPPLASLCPFDPFAKHFLSEFKHWIWTRSSEFGPASFRYLDEKYGPEFIRGTFPALGDQMNDDILRQRQALHEQHMAQKRQAHLKRMDNVFSQGARMALQIHRQHGPYALRGSVEDHLRMGGQDAQEYLRNVVHKLHQMGHGDVVASVLGGPSPQQAQPDVVIQGQARGGKSRYSFSAAGTGTPTLICLVCGAQIDLEQEPYRCITGVLSAERCLLAQQSAMLSAMRQDTRPVIPTSS